MKSTEPLDNWFRFDGESTEPEWDLETDSDDILEDDYSDGDTE